MPQQTSRFSISMSTELVEELDRLVIETNSANRSQTITKLVQDRITEHSSTFADREIAGTFVLVYDHHKRNLQSLLTSIQHDFQPLIISTLHVHLDHDNCLEVLVLRGKSSDVSELSARLVAVKGIKHGKLTVTTTGEAHEHGDALEDSHEPKEPVTYKHIHHRLK